MPEFHRLVCAVSFSLLIVFFAGGRTLGQGGVTPTVRDVEYANVDGQSLRLDLYLPATDDGPTPVIVWIHGGGWRSGDKAGGGPAARQVGRGYAVVSINYRLSTIATHPAQINDCKGAIRWLRAHARDYNLDPDRIAVFGSSAGGHLVSMLGTSGDVPELEGSSGGNLEFSSRVQAVVDWYGPSELQTMDEHALACSVICHSCPDSPESLLLGCPVTSCPNEAASASPISYVDAGDPPFLIHHGTSDCVVPPLQSQVFADALSAAGIDVSLTFIDGAGHGGPEFNMASVTDEVDAFFDRTLGALGPPVTAPEITSAAISDKKLVLHGVRFATGAVIVIDGTDQKTNNDAMAPDTVLTSRKARKRISRGETVNIVVRNPDGESSRSFAYTRP